MKKLNPDDPNVKLLLEHKSAVDMLAKLGPIMAQLPETEFDGFTIRETNGLMLLICSSITDEDGLLKSINEQIAPGEYKWKTMTEKLPSGDDPVVKCADSEAKWHRTYYLDHPLAEAMLTVAREMGPKKKLKLPNWFGGKR